jgi:hypothetical protein
LKEERDKERLERKKKEKDKERKKRRKKAVKMSWKRIKTMK